MSGLIALTFFLQNCAIYDKRPVNPEDVVNTGKVKIATKDGKRTAYERIYYKDEGDLYGFTLKEVRDTVEVILPPDRIEMIRSGPDPNYSKDRIKTTDGKTFKFDNYVQKNDTIYGQMTVKQQKEVLLLKEDILGVYAYNPKKSATGTVFLVIGMIPTGIILIATVIIVVDCWGEDCSQGWGGI